VLRVSAFQIGYPVGKLVLMKAYNFLFQGNPLLPNCEIK
jgi:hypothetical protein